MAITKRIPATEVKTHFGRIVQEVATKGTPVIIQNRGKDRAAIISLHDFRRLWPLEETRPAPERERVRAALRKTGLLSEPTAEMRCRAAEYDTHHPPEEQERIPIADHSTSPVRRHKRATLPKHNLY